jgi:hypothetical protein
MDEAKQWQPAMQAFPATTTQHNTTRRPGMVVSRLVSYSQRLIWFLAFVSKKSPVVISEQASLQTRSSVFLRSFLHNLPLPSHLQPRFPSPTHNEQEIKHIAGYFRCFSALFLTQMDKHKASMKKGHGTPFSTTTHGRLRAACFN